MLSLLADLRYALRRLRQAPGFALTAILTLALGIGATTAIFTLVYQVMLRPLPVAHPEQLYKVGKQIECCNDGGRLLNDWPLFSYSLYPARPSTLCSTGRTPVMGKAFPSS